MSEEEAAGWHTKKRFSKCPFACFYIKVFDNPWEEGVGRASLYRGGK
jgi:hypothetical protein